MSTPPPTQAEWTQAITGFMHCRGGGGGGGGGAGEGEGRV